MTRIIAFTGVLLSILIIYACLPDKGKNIPDVSNIQVDVNVRQFEKDLFGIDTSNISRERQALLKKYPVFMKDLYLPRILPALQDTVIFAAFVKSASMRKLKDTCDQVFGDFSDRKLSFDEAFRFHKYYFPEKPIPDIVTFISEYTLGVFTYEGILGVGLDFFLGENYPGYDPSFFPQYIRRGMSKEHMVAKSMEAVASDLVGEPRGEKLLDLMINNGKILYVIDCLTPHLPDSIKLGYTAAQTKWCNDNELQIWAHFLSEELLYETQLRDIRKLVEHSPNSPGMPPESPGRIANWTGWQIIKAYMKRYPETTLQQLIDNRDAQMILNKAKYKPG